MKKIFSMLLVGVIGLSGVACTSKTATGAEDNKQEPIQVEEKQEETPVAENGLVPEEGAKIVVWESEGPEQEWIKYVAEEFKNKYGVEVVSEAVETADAESRLAQDGPAGIGADIFAAHHDHLGSLVAAGLVQPNTNTGDRIKNDFMEAAYTGVAYQGTVYGYPTAIETYALFYNKDVFPEAPKSYDEIIAKAGEFNDPNANKYAFMWDIANAYYTHSFIANGGGYVFGQGGTDKEDVGLDSPGAIAGAVDMLKLKAILPVNSADSSSQIIEGLFDEGKVGAIIDGPWAVDGRKAAGVNFGVAPLPTMSNGERQSSFSGIRVLWVSAYTKYPNASKLFLEFATSDEMLLKRFEITNQIPPVKSLADADSIKNNEFVAPFLEQAGSAVPMPSISQTQYMWDPYAAAFGSMWNDGVSPEEALKTAADTMRSAIASEIE
ncbi:MAG TPA: maltose ABC transporter substrate-binding protein [Epulopiscium sp.]|nr:maltose ABC transporter substrate-binding protein [Candidatus Epulonipiscium sp.]